MHIRKARLGDLKACAKIHMQSETEESENSAADERLTLKCLKEDLEDRHYTLLVAEEAGRIIGYITFKYHEWSNMVWLEQLFVDRCFHRKGIGSRLVKNLLEVARKMNARIIFVDTRDRKGNSAIRFYRKNCFRTAGRIKGLYKENYGRNALIMSYKLKDK